MTHAKRIRNPPDARRLDPAEWDHPDHEAPDNPAKSFTLNPLAVWRKIREWRGKV